MSDVAIPLPTLEQYPATPQIPTLEEFPVTGEPGAVTTQAGGLMGTSRMLSGQGQQIRAISSAIAPSWRGEAASAYQGLAANVAGAFASAAVEIESAAVLMLRYAAELERLQREAAAAARQSQHWHQEIITWTNRVHDAQNALTHAQNELTGAEGRHAAAAAQGPKGAAAAAAASGEITHWQGAVRTAQQQLTRARQQLKNAHDQFTHWQNRGRSIRNAAMTAGEELALALLVITIVAPPLPGSLDYPALEPTPGILLNDKPAGEGQGGNGESGNGGQGGNGQGDGSPPEIKVVVGPDGKIKQPERPPTKPVIGDPKQEDEKAARQLQQGRDFQGKEPWWALVGKIVTGLVHLPPPKGPPGG